jgi:hypothetical protein
MTQLPSSAGDAAAAGTAWFALIGVLLVCAAGDREFLLHDTSAAAAVRMTKLAVRTRRISSPVPDSAGDASNADVPCRYAKFIGRC